MRRSPATASLVLALSVAPLAFSTGEAAAETASADAGVEVVICASHHRVLAHWLAAARAGRLPRSGVQVVHVDAHPDLAIPETPLPRGWPARADVLVAQLDIGSFQLAAIRTGLVERIVWLRPDWATQLPDGEHRFRLGTTADGALRVDATFDYYVLDGGWAPTAELRDSVAVELRVLSLSAIQPGVPLAQGPTILDIDLDAFATRNPAADELRAAGFGDADAERVRSIFARERLDLAEAPAERIAQLDEMLEALESLGAMRIAELPGALLALWRRGLGVRDLLALYRMLARAEDERALVTLLERGRELVGLPEHRASGDEIRATARAIGALVASGAVRPQLVTIARSVDDGFTPAGEWPAIERALLRELRDALGDVRVRFDVGLRPAPPSQPVPRSDAPR